MQKEQVQSVPAQAQPEELSQIAFRAYQECDFKTCRETLEILRKTTEETKEGKSDLKKNMRVRQNLLLTQYYASKGQSPHKLLADLQALAESQNLLPLSAAQVLSPTQNQMTNNSANSLSNSSNTSPGNSASQQQQVGSGASTTTAASAAASAAIFNADDSLNTALMYNCAAMAYQTQQLGVALGYLTAIFRNLHHFELFLQVKSLFMLLQVLYDLKQPEAAGPILWLLEVKYLDLKALTSYKKQIKESYCEQDGIQTPSTASSAQQKQTSSQDQTQKQSQTQQQAQSSGLSSGDSDPCLSLSFNEVLDEQLLNKNSSCILLGAYLRKYAIAPKNINLNEFTFLLNTYKALFKLQQNDYQAASELLQKANENRTGIMQDPVQFNTLQQDVQKSVTQQHIAMLRHSKAWVEQGKGNTMRAIQSMYLSEKEMQPQGSGGDKQNGKNGTGPGAEGLAPHKSCYSQKKQDQQSPADPVYQKCKQFHPQIYFNNLGILHLKLRKYALATFQFSKALKFLETAGTQVQSINNNSANSQSTSSSQSSTTSVWGENFAQPPLTSNPHQHISNMRGQRSIEILYNMGLSFYKSQKYDQAFRCLEKVSQSLRAKPELWYYMGLSVLQLNLQKLQTCSQSTVNNSNQNDKQDSEEQGYDVDSFSSKNGFTFQYERSVNQGALKRIQMAPQGDKITLLYEAMQQTEQEYLEKLKVTQTEITKARLKTIQSSMSKAQLKKQEKAGQLGWQASNTPKSSLSLHSAIMYFQNAQIAIQAEIKNAIIYRKTYKQLASGHVQSMQEAYNDAHAKIKNIDHLCETEAARRMASEAVGDQKKVSSNYGDENFVYPQVADQETQSDAEIRTSILHSYRSLSKNLLYYLSYTFLVAGDHCNCVKYGLELLNQKLPLTAQTDFTLRQYLAEAFSMLGKYDEAIQVLAGIDQQQQASQSPQSNPERAEQRKKEMQLEVTSVSKQVKLPERVPAKTVQSMNKAAIQLCQQDFMGAKQTLDSVLEAEELKLITGDITSASLLPGFMINTLVYFFLRTKNFKMARQLAKNRRFLIDPTQTESNPNQTSTSTRQRGNVNQYQSLSKSFT